MLVVFFYFWYGMWTLLGPCSGDGPQLMHTWAALDRLHGLERDHEAGAAGDFGGSEGGG